MSELIPKNTIPLKVTTARRIFNVPGVGSTVVNDVMVFDAPTAFEALLIFARVKAKHHLEFNQSTNLAIMIEPLKDGEIVDGYNDKKTIRPLKSSAAELQRRIA